MVTKRTQKRKQRKTTKSRKPAMMNAPTTNQVQTKLRQQQRPLYKTPNAKAMMNYDMAYIKCRTDPFNATGGGMIPDGSGKRVMVDHKLYFDFTTTNSGEARLLIAPFMPSPVLFKPGVTTAGMTLNGSPITQATTGATLDTAWVPGNYAEYTGWAQLPGLGFIIPYGALKARIVTQGYKIYYTGQASKAAGTITVQSAPIEIGTPLMAQNYTVSALNGTDAVSYTTVANDNAFPILPITASLTDTGITPDTYITRPESGIVGLLKRQNPVNSWSDIYSNCFAPMAASKIQKSLIATSNITTFIGSNAGSLSTSFGAVAFADDSFEAQYVKISGATDGTIGLGFRIEVITCVEYQVPGSSVVSKFLKTPPRASPQSIAVADSVMNASPIARPLTDTQAWWNTALRVAGGAAKAASAIPNPYTMAIGSAVSSITELLQNTTH